MDVVKRAAAHMAAVMRIILFIGFSIQIALGLVWLFCNFGNVQDFGEPDSALYEWLFGLAGKNHRVMYLLQLTAAFWAGNCLCGSLGAGSGSPEGEEHSCNGSGKGSKSFGGLWKLWSGLVLLTFPFALQCHLAVQPYSFMASLFMVLLSFPVKSLRGRRTGSRAAGGWKRRTGRLAGAAVCAGLLVLLSGATDREHREEPGRSFEAAMASRFAWPTIWNDRVYWTEDLRQIATDDVLWEIAYYPHNMEKLQARLEERAGKDGAKAYYLQIAKTGWEIHSSMVIRQIGWDVLGYMITPPVFQQQLMGNAYDSYTGRNYEVMRDHKPMLTRYYVDYACWWFGWMLVLVFGLTAIRMFLKRTPGWRKRMISLICCLIFSGVCSAILAMRGAGIMDYRLTIAVNELWLIWALLQMEQGNRGMDR